MLMLEGDAIYAFAGIFNRRSSPFISLATRVNAKVPWRYLPKIQHLQIRSRCEIRRAILLREELAEKN